MPRSAQVAEPYGLVPNSGQVRNMTRDEAIETESYLRDLMSRAECAIEMIRAKLNPEEYR